MLHFHEKENITVPERLTFVKKSLNITKTQKKSIIIFFDFVNRFIFSWYIAKSKKRHLLLNFAFYFFNPKLGIFLRFEPRSTKWVIMPKCKLSLMCKYFFRILKELNKKEIKIIFSNLSKKYTFLIFENHQKMPHKSEPLPAKG